MNCVKTQSGHLIEPHIIEPNFFLQRKLGGPAGRMINPLSISRAEAALKLAMPPVEEEVRRLLGELQHCIVAKSHHARATIWNHAHEIRGLAGTASKVCLGEAADIMCRYLNGTGSAFMPDEAVLSTIATVALLAVRDGADEDPMVKKLLADSVLAVDAQRQREGRGSA
jgi:hypothetical protein